MKISLLSLGCLKNQADSERLITTLSEHGIKYTGDFHEADAILVNTCGFIEEAKRESIDEILAFVNMKQEGQKLIVLGCLSERYREDLKGEIPEVDAMFGVSDDKKIIAYLEGLSDIKSDEPAVVHELYLAAGASAPLKVAEGCNRACTFCVIPSIRGKFRSREPKEILDEARSYLARGARELVLVAQDLTSYGFKDYELPELLRDLATLEDMEYWVRPMYLYPTAIDTRLLETIAAHERICSYIDIPLQHSQERVLRAMGRPGTHKEFLKLINKIRRVMPHAALRTTMIVGFPGETEEDFRSLLDFAAEARIEHLGAFAYSQEEGTPSARMEAQIPQETKQRRLDELMDLQLDISRECNERYLNTEHRAFVDELVEGGAVARLNTQAQDIDGITFIKDALDVKVGDFVDVLITSVGDFDLEAKLK
jgi:ribosomal protein S12 methylthiotransferase